MRDDVQLEFSRPKEQVLKTSPTGTWRYDRESLFTAGGMERIIAKHLRVQYTIPFLQCIASSLLRLRCPNGDVLRLVGFSIIRMLS